MTTNRIEDRFLGALFDCEFFVAGEWITSSETTVNAIIDDILNNYVSSFVFSVDDYISYFAPSFVTRTWYLNSVTVVRKTYRYIGG